MQTLSMGYLKPSNPDTGDAFWVALAFDIQRVNDHTHDGVNGQLLAITSQSILSGAWAAVASPKTGLYKQIITLPGAFIYDTTDFLFKLSSGEIVYPSIERNSSTTYTIYTTDNTLNYTAFYR